MKPQKPRAVRKHLDVAFDDVFLFGFRLRGLGLFAWPAAPPTAPAGRLRLLLGRLLFLFLWGLRLLRRPILLPGQDRIDQLLAAQPTVAVDRQLRRDRVQIGKRAVLERGAVKY